MQTSSFFIKKIIIFFLLFTPHFTHQQCIVVIYWDLRVVLSNFIYLIWRRLCGVFDLNILFVYIFLFSLTNYMFQCCILASSAVLIYTGRPETRSANTIYAITRRALASTRRMLEAIVWRMDSTVRSLTGHMTSDLLSTISGDTNRVLPFPPECSGVGLRNVEWLHMFLGFLLGI